VSSLLGGYDNDMIAAEREALPAAAAAGRKWGLEPPRLEQVCPAGSPGAAGRDNQTLPVTASFFKIYRLG